MNIAPNSGLLFTKQGPTLKNINQITFRIYNLFKIVKRHWKSHKFISGHFYVVSCRNVQYVLGAGHLQSKTPYKANFLFFKK